MVGNYNKATAGLEAPCGAFQELLQGTHFPVHLYAEGLVYLCKDLVLSALGEDLRHGAVKVSGGCDGAGFCYEPCNVTGAVHLSVEFQDALKVIGLISVYNVCGGELCALVHTHIQGRLLIAETESALCGVKLVAAYAKIGQDAVKQNILMAGVVLYEAEVVVDEGETGVLEGAVYSVDVTIEGDDSPVTG